VKSIRTIYATNNDGKNAFIEISFFTESATAGTNASVSNWSLQFVQDQKLRTSRSSLKYSDHSGAISVSPHFLQVISWLELRMDATVVMIISWLLLIVLPLRAQGCNNSAAFKFLARRFKLIFDQKNCATSRPLFGLLLNLRDEIIPLLRCNIRRACQPMSSSGTSKRCPIFAGFGSILLPGPLLLARSPFLFGYAKPVPVNFGALRNPRIGMVLVAAAGPAMNKQALGEGSGASCSPKVRQSFRFTLPTAREKKLLSFQHHLSTRHRQTYGPRFRIDIRIWCRTKD